MPYEKNVLEGQGAGRQGNWNVHYAGPDGVLESCSPKLVDAQTNPLGLDLEDPGVDDTGLRDELHAPGDGSLFVHLSAMNGRHSFFVPQMRIKLDAVPGMETLLRFEPVKTGEFEIACAQLCGRGHYRVNGYRTVRPQEALNGWGDEQTGTSPENQYRPPFRGRPGARLVPTVGTVDGGTGGPRGGGAGSLVSVGSPSGCRCPVLPILRGRLLPFSRDTP